MKIANEQFESACSAMYNRLVDFMLEKIDLNRVSTVLEAGCGSGRLTIPLAERGGEKWVVIAYDLFMGSYKKSLEILRETIQKKDLDHIVKIIIGDVRNMKGIKNETVDLIVSNELFCDLDLHGLETTLLEFYRILRFKGQMVHAELVSIPENKAQEFFIKADYSYSLETMTLQPEWFSPSADEVATLLHKTGFTKINVNYFETNLKLNFNAALKRLKEWNVDPSFTTTYEKELRRYGLEFPMEHVISCEKI
ncbi:MAG: methyltransferase domain-containing protein [Candidatus Heimdallarchaeota archaeon]